MKNKLAISLALISLTSSASAIAPELEKYNYSIKPIQLIDKNLLNAMITIESGGNTYAYNKKTGATGLLQLTPVIYKNLCGMTKEDAFNPDKNIACGSLYMKHLLAKYHNNLEKALLHYNNGHTITNYQYSKKVINKMNDK